jgi:ankyrin repeat protein
MSPLLVAFFLGVLAHALVSRIIGVQTDRRDTPLHVACRKGNVKNVKALLDRGADPNVFNFFRETPLLLACAADSAAIVKMLLDMGADAKDKGASPPPSTPRPGTLELPCSYGGDD